jgi:hypothetical protein
LIFSSKSCRTDTQQWGSVARTVFNSISCHGLGARRLLKWLLWALIRLISGAFVRPLGMLVFVLMWAIVVSVTMLMLVRWSLPVIAAVGFLILPLAIRTFGGRWLPNIVCWVIHNQVRDLLETMVRLLWVLLFSCLAVC